jgi:hypothetical protein
LKIEEDKTKNDTKISKTNSSSSNEKKKKGVDFLFIVEGNLDAKIPVLDTNKKKVHILPSLDIYFEGAMQLLRRLHPFVIIMNFKLFQYLAQ